MKRYTEHEMRVRADYLEGALADSKTAAMLRQAADMIEREATREKSSQVGNAAKMLEALEQIHELLSIGGKPDTAMCIRYEAAYQIAKEALSAPQRNCDRYALGEAFRKYGFPSKKNQWGEKKWIDFCEWYIS